MREISSQQRVQNERRDLQKQVAEGNFCLKNHIARSFAGNLSKHSRFSLPSSHPMSQLKAP